MLCSILIPSRGRAARLQQTVRSIYATSAFESFNILVRLDDDDEQLSLYRQLLQNIPDVRIVVGPRYAGWKTLHKLYDELAAMTDAKWLWIMNDDAIVSGKGWDLQLEQVPQTGFIVQPEISKLHASEYRDWAGGPFPIFPNGSWKPEWDSFADPIDVAIDVLLRGQKGWQTHFLKDICVAHERDDEETLAKHREVP